MDHSGCEPRWVPTALLCRELGISRSTLQKLKQQGSLPGGICFYRRGLKLSAPCMWNVEECRKAVQRLSSADPALLETYEIRTGA